MSIGVMERVWRKFMFPRYGNSLPYPTNRRYARYVGACQARYGGAADRQAAALAEKVRADGFVQIENALAPDVARAMSAKISALIAAEPDDKNKGRTAHLQYRVKQPIRVLGAEVLDLFRGPADAVLQAYFGSLYRLHSVACYRSVPTDDPQGAWLWHIDNYPPYVKKIMLYLTDCDPKLGATSFISPGETAKLREGGYFGIFPEERSENLDRFAARAGITPRAQTREIKAGSALLFDNNTLHRANIPEVGYRDVITFTVMPSAEPWEQVLQREGVDKMEARKAMYPADPAS
jgi:hypothetical protein